MNRQAWDDVERALAGALVPEEAHMVEAREAAIEQGFPEHQVAANQGALLMLLARSANAKRVLEVGTLGGYSTLWLLRGLRGDGSIDTLEIDAARAAFARAIFERAGAHDRISLHEGAARETLARFIDEGRSPYDFVFIDADKPNNPHYLEASLALTRPGSLIVVDNVVRDGEVANPESTDERVAGVRAMFEMIRDDPRIEATALQTVGSKGWDGFALLRVLD